MFSQTTKQSSALGSLFPDPLRSCTHTYIKIIFDSFRLKSPNISYLAIIFAPIPELTLGTPGFIDFKLLLCVGPMKGLLLLKIGFGTAAGLENIIGLVVLSQVSG